MSFLSYVKDVLGRRKEKSYAKMLNGRTPIFNSCGENVFAYDIMRNAISVNCKQMAKLAPKHIRIDPATGEQVNVTSSINRLLAVAPNPYMTVSDFLYKCNYLYDTTDNCYIYPAYVKQYVNKTQYKRIYTGFYPLAPESVEFHQDNSGEIWVYFRFPSGDEVTLKYADVIHWKKNVCEYDVVGGTAYADTSFINLLNADNTAMQGIDKAVKSKFTVQGIVKINSWQDEEHQTQIIKEFEEKLAKSKSGIMPIDVKADYIPLSIDPKIVDKETMEFIQKRILARVGVSLPVYNNSFTEEEYQAYYEMTIEPRIKSLGEAFCKGLFTPREIEVGNRVIAYQQGLLYSSLNNKIKAVHIISQLGILTDNQLGAIFGYPPFEGGDVRHVSLNYIDRNYSTEYQLNKTKGDKPVIAEEGGKNDGKEK